MRASPLVAAVEGIGLLGPGLPDWASGAAVLAGERPWRSAPTVLGAPAALPPAERRRAGTVIRLALLAGAQAVEQSGRAAGSLPAVFASSGGDGENCHALCTALAEAERSVSPTRFHNSVHNAAAGYWSIAHGCTEASVTLCAYDASFAAGLLEAVTQVQHIGAPVLLVAYDADFPPPLRTRRPIPDAFGASLLLAPEGSARALARLRLSLCREPASPAGSPGLEALRAGNPAARALPLLEPLARRAGARVVLEYLDPDALAVEVFA